MLHNIHLESKYSKPLDVLWGTELGAQHGTVDMNRMRDRSGGELRGLRDLAISRSGPEGHAVCLSW